MKMYYDLSKLSDEQLAQFNDLKKICEISKDEELSNAIAKAVETGIHKEKEIEKGKQFVK